MDKNNVSVAVWLALLLLFAFFVLGIALGSILEENVVRQQAIDAGVAEWTIDPKTGEREFRWGASEEESKP